MMALLPIVLSKMPTKGPVAIQANPIIDTIDPISQGPMPLTSPRKTGNIKIGAYIETPKTTTFTHPIVKFLFLNTFKSITGFLAVISL